MMLTNTVISEFAVDIRSHLHHFSPGRKDSGWVLGWNCAFVTYWLCDCDVSEQ